MANLGSITVNEIEIIEVDASPVTSGVDASIGSLAILTDGSKIFLKSGSLITNWTPINSLIFSEFAYRVNTIAQSSTSATYANVTELTSEVLQTGTYLFEYVGLCQSTAVGTGVGVRIGAGTATLGVTFGQWQIAQAADGTDKYFQYNQVNATTNISSASVQTANADFVVKGSGSFTVTAAGTVAIQLRSETGTSVSVRIGSVLFIKKVI